ncbi:MAG: glutamyl-tRNA reductase [Thermoplasmatota archaeon]
MIVSAHVTHQSADMSCLELVGREGTDALLEALSRVEGVRECAVLRTCNRVEFYAESGDRGATREGMESIIARYIPADQRENLIRYLSGKESIHHLLRVTCGLESMMVGEDQIQHQVREAYERAGSAGTLGPVLYRVFRKAISVGKKVRTETSLGRGQVSVGSAAVALAEDILGDLSGKGVLIVGAGETATLIAKHLRGKGPRAIFVSNRTYQRAVELAFHLGGKAVRLNGLFDYLRESDIVLVATASPHVILDRERVAAALEEREGGLVIIDISFPRNVDDGVGDLEGVSLYDIDSLRGVAKENLMARVNEVRGAERIVAEELDLLTRRLEEMRASEVISALHMKYNGIKEREMRRAMNRLNGQGDQERVLEDFANALTSRFLADPVRSLKAASREDREEILQLARHLFKVESEDDVS